MIGVAVSVIIPVYNTAPYLRQMLESLRAQTLQNIEILCVDDGSTDGSADILAEYAKVDKRIRILTQQNKGAGAARNKGLGFARGKYLSFLDSDDLFEPHMLATAYHEAERHEADFVIFGADSFSSLTGKRLPSDYILRYEQVPAGAVFSAEQMPDRLFTFSHNVVWNKLYRKAFVDRHTLRFQEIFSSNDIRFACAALMLAQRIRCIPDMLLHYRREAAGQLSRAFKFTGEDWPMLKAFEATYQDIHKLKKFAAVSQNFADWSLEYLVEFWHYSKKNQLECRCLINRWQAKVGQTRHHYASNYDYLCYGEFTQAGFIRRFFGNPRLMVDPLYRLPSLPIRPGATVVLYCAGMTGTDYWLQLLDQGIFRLAAWVDGNAEALFAQGWPVVPPEALEHMEYDFVLVAMPYKAIIDQLGELGVPDEKIIFIAECGE